RDWSSDVCSSGLSRDPRRPRAGECPLPRAHRAGCAALRPLPRPGPPRLAPAALRRLARRDRRRRPAHSRPDRRHDPPRRGRAGGGLMLRHLLRTYLAPYRGWLTAIVLLQFTATAAMLYLPSLNADIIDKGIARGDTGYIVEVG